MTVLKMITTYYKNSLKTQEHIKKNLTRKEKRTIFGEQKEQNI